MEYEYKNIHDMLDAINARNEDVLPCDGFNGMVCKAYVLNPSGDIYYITAQNTKSINEHDDKFRVELLKNAYRTAEGQQNLVKALSKKL